MASRITTLAATAACCALVLAAAGPATAATAPATATATTARASDVPSAGAVAPAQDPFYSAPADIGSYAPGQIVATRPVSVTLLGLPTGTDAWQISYRTNDSHGQPELTVTTLMVPGGAASGSDRPVVSLQAPEDSTGSQCAPSYTLASGTDVADLADAATLLLKGWAVAVPDFEGPRSVFMAGPQAGHAVLDGIRAVRNFRPAEDTGIGAGSPWALDGYSGGAEATGWAAQLQPSYAPDVRLAGAAMGGVPADPTAVARSLDGGAAAGFEMAAAWSISTEFPEAKIPSLLNAQGRQDFADTGGKCMTQLLAAYPFKKLASDTTVPDPLSVPSVAAVLNENKLGAQAPATPVYDYHADTDEIVPVGQDDSLVKDWCAKGATVDEVRDPVGEHVEEAVARRLSVLDFLSDRFAGRSADSGC
ncbi:lipase family protein [Streptomyces sp. ICBB 8177]|uniref:lipase family protein n=1 Tax=Streptomyces sp. ICBB 8177 TaxID=563922 RepID=UPI000D67E163|nr:lipase family protein [Streptomyces sp. ICBB 8177]PWI42580.1 triacylglycerol lipase [Streptomyces sp. ICBB 8177]